MFELAYWHWIIFGFVLIGLEIVLSTFITLWFGIAAVVVGLALLVFSISLGWQVTLWALLSILLAAIWFFRLKPSIGKRKANEIRDSIINQSGMVIKAPSEHQKGILRFYAPIAGSDEWAFVCDTSVNFGDTVCVIDMINDKLLQVKVDNQ